MLKKIFNLKTHFIFNMFISCALLLILILLMIMRDESLVQFLLWSVVIAVNCWTPYYDKKNNGITALKSKISNSDEPLFLKSYLLYLSSAITSFVIISVDEFVIKQQRGVFALIVLSIILVGIIFMLYKIVRIVTVRR